MSPDEVEYERAHVSRPFSDLVPAAILENHCLLYRVDAPQMPERHEKQLGLRCRVITQLMQQARGAGSYERIQARRLYPDQGIGRRWWLLSLPTWHIERVKLEGIRERVTKLRTDIPPGAWQAALVRHCYIDWYLRPVPEGVSLIGQPAREFWKILGRRILVELQNRSSNRVEREMQAQLWHNQFYAEADKQEAGRKP